ncbi:fumarylacetoacetate hydrolase family protein [Microbacterium soli]|uniref:Fumarylacetoacetate hydrolase family protein n=1 Tax=Microbacterium soli TaxID=446075 RepID=A0ABP7NBX8_9MICO
MHLALVRVDDGEQFAVREDGEAGWCLLRSLGAEPRDLPEAVRAAAEVSATALASAPRERSVTLGAVARSARKILAVGLNYRSHVEETGMVRPDAPIIFVKYSSSVIGPTDAIRVDPSITTQVDYEAELAVVIGRSARRVSEADALAHVFGYAVANDVSARDLQAADSQISRSKSLDTFGPIGPWITTADAVPDPQSLTIRSFVDDEPRQDSTTSLMLYSVAELISYLSRTTTLEPGDVILTGTPKGVGLGFTPPRFLSPGSTVRCEVSSLGEISNPVLLDPSDELS